MEVISACYITAVTEISLLYATVAVKCCQQTDGSYAYFSKIVAGNFWRVLQCVERATGRAVCWVTVTPVVPWNLSMSGAVRPVRPVPCRAVAGWLAGSPVLYCRSLLAAAAAAAGDVLARCASHST